MVGEFLAIFRGRRTRSYNNRGGRHPWLITLDPRRDMLNVLSKLECRSLHDFSIKSFLSLLEASKNSLRSLSKLGPECRQILGRIENRNRRLCSLGKGPKPQFRDVSIKGNSLSQSRHIEWIQLEEPVGILKN